jgi:hypothetical protein
MTRSRSPDLSIYLSLVHSTGKSPPPVILSEHPVHISLSYAILSSTPHSLLLVPEGEVSPHRSLDAEEEGGGLFPLPSSRDVKR